MRKKTPLIPALPHMPVSPGCARGKKSNDRIQRIVAENCPMNFLASPDILIGLIGANRSLARIQPANLAQCLLWNVEQLCLRNGAENSCR